jgi:hypothetical protein
LLLVVAADVVATRHVATVSASLPLLHLMRIAVAALFVLIVVAVACRNWPWSSAMDRRQELLHSSLHQEQKKIVSGKDACFVSLDRALMSNAIPAVKAPTNTSPRLVHHRQALARSRSNRTALASLPL